MTISTVPRFTTRQLWFKELFVGTLIYLCVLGFFEEYTDIVYAQSFSLLVCAAVVLEVLTFFTLLAKKMVFAHFRTARTLLGKTASLIGTWLVLFLSKFVFIGIIDLVFMGTVTVYGFFNIFLVVLCVTAIHKLADYVFVRLGDSKGASI